MKRIALSLAFMGFLFTGMATAADSVAFVTDIKGDVKVDGTARPALMSELSTKQKLSLSKGAGITVMYVQSGQEFVLSGPGDYTVDAKSLVAEGKSAQPVNRKTDWKISSQALVKVSQTSSASIRMRSMNPNAGVADTKIGALLYPVRGSIASFQPVLSWQATGASAYDVSIALSTEPDKPIAAGKSNSATHKFSTRLKPDTEYVWTVTAGGTELGRGKFRTLSEENIALVEKRKPDAKASFSDRLLYAVLLNDLGATQDAQSLWANLAAERKDLPELASLGKAK